MSHPPEIGARPCSNPRLCDLCNSSMAFLYCRADSAKLCFNCDREAHFSNPLFQKHTRSLLCDACDSAPCSIFCANDSSVLCQNCDWEIHGNSIGVHDRRPTEGFSGCPSVTELLNFLGLEDLTKKNDEDDDGWMDLLVWETASVVNLDNLIVTKDCADSPHSFQALGVPPLPKNRNSICGKHKEDILRQLREMAINVHDFDACLGVFDVSVSDNSVHLQTSKLSSVPLSEQQISSSEQGHGFPLIETNHSISEIEPDTGDANHFVPDVFQVPCNSVVRELNSQERDCALSRYKEKKKTRRYEKQIRYESRKVRAEGRTRIRGRFAKIER